MHNYSTEELQTKLIRPLKAGESFLVAKNIELNTAREMRDFCGDWMTIFKTDRSDQYMHNSPSIEPDGQLTSYRVTEDDGLWEWFPYHMNIYQTNLRLLKTDRTLSSPIKYFKRLPIL